MDKTNRRKQRNTEEDWKAYLEKRREYRNAWRKNLKKKGMKKKTSEAPEYEFPSIYSKGNVVPRKNYNITF